MKSPPKKGNLGDNIKNQSTPKFIMVTFEKDNNNKINNSGLEFPIFEDLKDTQKNNNQNIITNNEESKNYILKENFSLSSFQINNSSKNLIEKIDNTISKMEKNEPAQLNVCEKSDKSSLNDEIIYKEKETNNSNSSNKDTDKIEDKNNLYDIKEINEEEYKEDNNTFNNEKENKNGNEYNGKKLTDKKKDTFKYNLPLENDTIPVIGIFNKKKHNCEDSQITKRNRPLNIIRGEDDLFSSKMKITKYSKKKVKSYNFYGYYNTFHISKSRGLDYSGKKDSIDKKENQASEKIIPA